MKQISLLSFLILFAIATHFSGLYSAHRGWETHKIFQSMVAARKAWLKVEDGDIYPTRAESPFQRDPGKQNERFSKIARTGQQILVPGGFGLFSDECGPSGCLAVAYDRTGRIAHSWPFKESAVLAVGPKVRGSYTYAGKDRFRDTYVTSLQAFSNGDLLVTLNLRNSYPYGWGLLRMAKDGSVIWRIADYYHHQPTIGDNGNIYTPFYEIRKDAVYEGVDRFKRPFVRCPNPENQYADFVHILSANGSILKRIDLIALFLASERYGSYLSRTINSCDPLHLNSVDVASASDARTTSWLKEGDMLVSLRAPSIVAVIDSNGNQIKRVYSGSFVNQHSAQFLGNGELVLFDNMGGDTNNLPSRVLAVNLDNNIERVIYGRGKNVNDLSEYSPTVGNIALSSGNERALVSFTRGGHLVELDLGSGAILSRYDHFQNPTGAPDHPELFKLFAATYLTTP